ncbi:unnamed protein product [Oppiella nova]|uniref:GH18 domain-containing protein n=1 Tax=Oppiella nova TaxID=334625 RepID=A0A7R9MJQ1_9ACAR|nr:unnamed protein product [Oppiella nova]CAG2178646.1 unnamed protein product [Oppiella nova]
MGIKMFEQFNNLRTNNAKLKTLVAIGGNDDGSDKYSQMANNPVGRQFFVNSTIEEYPAMSARDSERRKVGKSADKQAFIDLLRELRTAFQPHEYLLTAGVSVDVSIVDRAYNVPEMNKYLDFINVMAFDMHGSWEHKTGHVAPLYAGDNDNETQTVQYVIDYWLRLGAQPDKLTKDFDI